MFTGAAASFLSGFAVAQGSPCSMQSTQPAVYPPIAKAAHVEGDVLFRAAFDHGGALTSLDLVSGPRVINRAEWIA